MTNTTELQENNDGNRLTHVQAMLFLEMASRKPDWTLLDTYQHDLDLLFEDWLYVELMTQHELDNFDNAAEVRTWKQSSHSQVYLLVGYNHESCCLSNQCWVSPVVLHMTRKLKHMSNADAYAFYLIGHQEPTNIQHILSIIVLQLLEQSRVSLRNEEQYTELCAELQIYRKSVEVHGRSGDSRDTNEALERVALKALNMFAPTETVWIFLDRVDRCRSSSRKANGKRLLKALVHLVEKASLKVRVLVTVNGYDWPADSQVDELGYVHRESIYCSRMEQSSKEDKMVWR